MKSIVAALAALFTLAAAAHAQPSDESTRVQAREILGRIVSYDSSPEGGRTPELAAYLADLYRNGGFPSCAIAATARAVGRSCCWRTWM
jgi:hypothetical protein